jgi:hypothetical protein
MKEQKIPGAGEPTSASLESSAKSPRRIIVVDGNPVLGQLHFKVLIRQGGWVNAAEADANLWWELPSVNRHLPPVHYDWAKIPGLGSIQKLRPARLSVPVIMVASRWPAQKLATTWFKPFAADALSGPAETVPGETTSRRDQRIALTARLWEKLKSSSNKSRR